MEKIKNIIIGVLVIIIIVLVFISLSGNKEDKEDSNASLYLPVYEYNRENKIMYTNNGTNDHDNLVYKLSYTVPCEYDLCYWVFGKGNTASDAYWMLYDGEDRNVTGFKGGYYLYDSQSKKKVEGPFTALEIIEPNGEEAIRTIKVGKDDMYGLYDILDKKFILNIEYEDISIDNGKIVVKKDGKSGIYDGNKISDFIYDDMEYTGIHDLYRVKSGNKQTLMYLGNNTSATFKEDYEYADIILDDTKESKLYIIYISNGKLLMNTVTYSSNLYTKNIDGNNYMHMGNNYTVIAEVTNNLVSFDRNVEIKDGKLILVCHVVRDINNKDVVDHYTMDYDVANRNVKVTKS